MGLSRGRRARLTDAAPRPAAGRRRSRRRGRTGDEQVREPLTAVEVGPVRVVGVERHDRGEGGQRRGEDHCVADESERQPPLPQLRTAQESDVRRCAAERDDCVDGVDGAVQRRDLVELATATDRPPDVDHGVAKSSGHEEPGQQVLKGTGATGTIHRASAADGQGPAVLRVQHEAPQQQHRLDDETGVHDAEDPRREGIVPTRHRATAAGGHLRQRADRHAEGEGHEQPRRDPQRTGDHEGRDPAADRVNQQHCQQDCDQVHADGHDVGAARVGHEVVGLRADAPAEDPDGLERDVRQARQDRGDAQARTPAVGRWPGGGCLGRSGECRHAPRLTGRRTPLPPLSGRLASPARGSDGQRRGSTRTSSVLRSPAVPSCERSAWMSLNDSSR